MSGAAWVAVKTKADGPLGKADLADQDTKHNINTLAAALVYARTGDERYRVKAIEALRDIKGTESGARSLALGRNVAAYVIAADLIGDPEVDSWLKPWLRDIVRRKNAEGRSLIMCHEDRPNNWGTMCGASRIAVALYTDDNEDLKRAAEVLQGYVGDRDTFAGFEFQDGSFSFICDDDEPRPINPEDCVESGKSLSGAVVDDLQRAGSFSLPLKHTNYAWGGLSGAVAQAEMLDRAGYDAYEWEERGILRATEFLEGIPGWERSSATRWVSWVVNGEYGTDFSAQEPTSNGRLLAFTDWTHAG